MKHGTSKRSGTSEFAGSPTSSLNVNRNYKDTVFRMLFKQKHVLLSLYNALRGTSYPDPEQLRIVTLENAIYMGMKNDLAFILDSSLNLYEHQSTVCPNIPLRNLMYVADELEKMIDKKRLLSRRKLLIPTPEFVVFYNGKEPRPEREEMRLSDLFEEKTEDPRLELKVTVLNINPGMNEELKTKCREIAEYMQYVECVRRYEKELPLEAAVDTAVTECIEMGILKEFLIRNRSEVMHRCLYEYDEEEAREVWREDAREEGLEEGRKQGLEEGLEEGRKRGLEEGIKEGLEAGAREQLKLMVKRKIAKNKTPEIIAQELEESVENINILLAEIQEEPSL